MIINHGVRGSIPNPHQNNMIFGGNTPCVEIRTEKYQLIFDCGSGFSNIDFSNDLETIIFISHFHHDHIQGLAFNKHFTSIKKKIIITSAHSNKKETYNNLINYYSSPYFQVNFFEIINIFKYYICRNCTSYPYTSFNTLDLLRSSNNAWPKFFSICIRYNCFNRAI